MSLPQSTQVPPHAALMQILTGKWVSSAVSAVAKFGIADLLEHGPKTIKQLAGATGTQEHALYRVLRACASIGIFAELEDGGFENTPLPSPCGPMRSHASATWR